MFLALATALIRNRPLHRERLVAAVAYALASGDMAAADYFGGFLSRHDFAAAYGRAADRRRKSGDRVARRAVLDWRRMFRCIARKTWIGGANGS
jgi:hypothetical protein